MDNRQSPRPGLASSDAAATLLAGEPMSPKKTTAELSFFDASAYIGLPIHMPSVGPGGLCATAEDLLAEMDRSGIEKALV